MPEVTLPLKLVAYVTTPGTPSQVRDALIASGLRAKAENKIIALAATDPQTGVPSFDWKLGVSSSGRGVVIYPKLTITVDTTRTPKQILNAVDDYFGEMKNQLRALAASFPSTSVTKWHVHRGDDGDPDEVEP